MANDSKASSGFRGYLSRLKKRLREPNEPSTNSSNANPGSSSPDPHGGKGNQQTLWETAYEQVKKNDPSLMEEYEMTLWKRSTPTGQAASGLSATQYNIPLDPKDRYIQSMQIMRDGLAALKSPDIDERTVRLIDTTSRFANEAVRISPEASVAWAAVSFWIPLVINTHTEHEALRFAFEYVLCRAPYYAGLEQEMLSNSTLELSSTREQDIESKFIAVYAKVIEFQARAVRHSSMSGGQIVTRRAIKWDKWEEQLRELKEVDGQLHQVIRFHSSSKLTELAKDLSSNVEDMGCELKEINQSMHRLVSVGEEQLRVTQDHRGIARQQLDILERSHAHVISEEEKQCRELFRIDVDKPDYKFYKGRVKVHTPGTCEWLTEHEIFQVWLKENAGPLLITADPGCGKSVLSKYLVDDVLPQRQIGAAICYFFFKDKIQETLRPALCALLHQLFCQQPGLIGHAMSFFTPNSSTKENFATVNVALDIIERIAKDQKVTSVIFVIDALDECVRDDQERLIDFFNDMFARVGAHSRLKIIITSRPYVHIVSRLRNPFPDTDFHVAGEELMKKLMKEIDVVIAHQVKEMNMGEELTNYLTQRLCEFNNRTYLWVSFVFDSKTKDATAFKRTKSGIDKWLRELPKSVEDYYTRILRDASDPRLVYKVICFLLVAQRPLTVSEMNEAVNVSTADTALDLETVDDFRHRIRRDCGLFISIHDDRLVFLHQTAREYLLQDGHPLPSNVEEHRTAEDNFEHNALLEMDKPPSSWCHAITIPQAHAVVADCCLSFLTMQGLMNRAEQLRKRWARTIGVKNSWNSLYFTRNQKWDEDPEETMWTKERDMSDSRRFEVNEDAEHENYLSSDETISASEDEEMSASDDDERTFSGDEVMSASGNKEMSASGCKEMSASGDDKKSSTEDGGVSSFGSEWSYDNDPFSGHTGRTPPSYVKVCGVLIHTGLPDDYICHNLRRKFHFFGYASAAWKDHILDSRVSGLQIDPRTQRLCYSTVSSPCLWRWAARDRVLGIYHHWYDNVRAWQLYSWPAHHSRLHCFASLGFLHAIKQRLSCLGHGSEFEETSQNPKDPLWHRVHCELHGVYWNKRVLRFRSAGTTPLWESAAHGFSDIVKELLRHGADANAHRVQTGTTPLHRACLGDHSQVLQVLLEAGASVDMKDSHGNTPIWHAISGTDDSKSNHCLKILVKIPHLLNSVIDDKGNTPLHLTCSFGYADSTRLLLSNGADPYIRDVYGQTPLLRCRGHDSSEFWHSQVAKLLLEHSSNRDPPLYEIAAYHNGDTILHYASRDRQCQLLNVLLASGAPVDVRGNHMRTPLHTAFSLRPCIRTVDVLLEHQADPNIKDDFGLTPLTYAVLGRLSSPMHFSIEDYIRPLLKAGARANAGDYLGNDLECAAFIPLDTDFIMLNLGRAVRFANDADAQTRIMNELIAETPFMILQALHPEITQDEIEEWREKAATQKDYWLDIRRKNYD